MNRATIKMPASAAGSAHEEKHNSSYNKNLSHLYCCINTLCMKWRISREDFGHSACIYALMFRDHAPRSIQIYFTGKPSFYSKKAKELALAFFITFVEASERLDTLNGDPVDALECWKIALQLIGGNHE